MKQQTTGMLVFALVLAGAMPEQSKTHKYGVKVGSRTLWYATAREATKAANEVAKV